MTEQQMISKMQGNPKEKPSFFNLGVVSAIYLVLMIFLYWLGSIDLFNEYYIHILSIIGMNIILVASLNIVNGYLGEFALGHAGFMGVGAYAAAIIATYIHVPGDPIIAMIITLTLALIGGTLMAGLIGYLVGLITFKTVGDYLAIITLGFNMIIVNAIQNIDFVGGPRGFTGIPKFTNLIVVAICVVITYNILYHLVNSNYGRIWVSIRENPIAAELMGVNVNRAKNFAFTIAAALAGLAGGLWAQYQQFITPRSFDYVKTTDFLVMLYFGGMGSLSGSILGVVVYIVMMEVIRNLLSAFAPQLAELRVIFGPLILIIIMLTNQFGMMGNKEWRWLRHKEEGAVGGNRA